MRWALIWSPKGKTDRTTEIRLAGQQMMNIPANFLCSQRRIRDHPTVIGSEATGEVHPKISKQQETASQKMGSKPYAHPREQQRSSWTPPFCIMRGCSNNPYEHPHMDQNIVTYTWELAPPQDHEMSKTVQSASQRQWCRGKTIRLHDGLQLLQQQYNKEGRRREVDTNGQVLSSLCRVGAGPSAVAVVSWAKSPSPAKEVATDRARQLFEGEFGAQCPWDQRVRI